MGCAGSKQGNPNKKAGGKTPQPKGMKGFMGEMEGAMKEMEKQHKEQQA